MFERYTEYGRRVIFFARYEASEFGSPTIEPEHLLLGVLRERSSLGVLLPTSIEIEQVRREFQAGWPVREKISTSVDLPLADAARRVLVYAAEEAERLSQAHISTQHLLLALLRESTAAAAMLQKHGLDVEELRTEIVQAAAEPGMGSRNREAVNALREKFAQISGRLTPEIEPAANYLLQLPASGPERAE